VFKTEPTQSKSRKPNQSNLKPQKIALGSDDFCMEPRGSVWFAVCISATEPNQTKPQD